MSKNHKNRPIKQKTNLAVNRLFSLKRYRVIFGLMATVFCSLAITFFIFKTYYGDLNFERFEWLFHHERNQVFLGSWLVILMVDLILLGVFQSAIVANGSLAIFSVIWLFVNQVKMASRQTPFLPEDLFLVTEAQQMSSVIRPEDFAFLLRSLTLIIAMILGAFFFKKLCTNYPKFRRRTRLSLSLLMIASGALWLAQINNSIKDPELMRSTENFIKNGIIPWNQQVNFFWNGPVIGTLYNIGKVHLDKPADYSEARIKQIVDKYQQQLATANQNRIDPSAEPVNVVFVLSESLVDTSRISNFYNFKQNPLPHFQKLLSENPSGQLATSEYGGGTANVEFEIMTGLSTTLNQETTPYTHFFTKLKDFPSTAALLKKQNFQTIALHNYYPQMYKRHLAYPNLGFQEFHSIDNFQNRSTIGNNPYDSDTSFFTSLITELQKNPQQAKFIHGISMQNHTPYYNLYDLNEQFIGRTGLNDEDEYQKLDTYLTGLSYTDKALEDFYQKLQTIEQKTVVVLYGDHYPGANVFWRVNEADSKQSHTTPILVMSNFALPNQPQIGNTSGNYLTNIVFDSLNWKKSAFQLMLDEARQAFPQLSLYHIDNQNTLEQSAIYHDYHLIQYDLLNGQRFSQKMGFFDQK